MVKTGIKIKIILFVILFIRNENIVSGGVGGCLAGCYKQQELSGGSNCEDGSKNLEDLLDCWAYDCGYFTIQSAQNCVELFGLTYPQGSAFSIDSYTNCENATELCNGNVTFPLSSPPSENSCGFQCEKLFGAKIASAACSAVGNSLALYEKCVSGCADQPIYTEGKDECVDFAGEFVANATVINSCLEGHCDESRGGVGKGLLVALLVVVVGGCLFFAVSLAVQVLKNKDESTFAGAISVKAGNLLNG